MNHEGQIVSLIFEQIEYHRKKAVSFQRMLNIMLGKDENEGIQNLIDKLAEENKELYLKSSQKVSNLLGNKEVLDGLLKKEKAADEPKKDLKKLSSVNKAILTFLQHNGLMSKQEVVDHLTRSTYNISAVDLGNRLFTMKADGFLMSPKRGYYQIAKGAKISWNHTADENDVVAKVKEVIPHLEETPASIEVVFEKTNKFDELMEKHDEKIADKFETMRDEINATKGKEMQYFIPVGAVIRRGDSCILMASKTVLTEDDILDYPESLSEQKGIVEGLTEGSNMVTVRFEGCKQLCYPHWLKYDYAAAN